MNKSRSLAVVGWSLLAFALWLGVGRAPNAPALHDAQVMTAILVFVALLVASAFRAEWNLLRRHPACLALLGWYLGTVLAIALAIGAPLAGFALLGGSNALVAGIAIGALVGLVLLVVATLLFDGWCAAYLAALADRREPELWDALVLAAKRLPRVGALELVARAPAELIALLIYATAFRTEFSVASTPNAALVAACIGLPLAFLWNVATASALTSGFAASARPESFWRRLLGGVRVARATWWRVGAHMVLVGSIAYVAFDRPADAGGSAKHGQALTLESGLTASQVRMEVDAAGDFSREQRIVVFTGWTGGLPFASRWLAGDGSGNSTGPQNFPSAVACVAVFFSSLALRLFVARALAQRR